MITKCNILDLCSRAIQLLLNKKIFNDYFFYNYLIKNVIIIRKISIIGHQSLFAFAKIAEAWRRVFWPFLQSFNVSHYWVMDKYVTLNNNCCIKYLYDEWSWLLDGRPSSKTSTDSWAVFASWNNWKSFIFGKNFANVHILFVLKFTIIFYVPFYVEKMSFNVL